MSSWVITSARISGVTVAVSVIIGVPGGTRARNSCRRANDGLNFGLLFVCAWTLNTYYNFYHLWTQWASSTATATTCWCSGSPSNNSRHLSDSKIASGLPNKRLNFPLSMSLSSTNNLSVSRPPLGNPAPRRIAAPTPADLRLVTWSTIRDTSGDTTRTTLLQSTLLLPSLWSNM